MGKQECIDGCLAEIKQWDVFGNHHDTAANRKICKTGYKKKADEWTNLSKTPYRICKRNCRERFCLKRCVGVDGDNDETPCGSRGAENQCSKKRRSCEGGCSRPKFVWDCN